jgi:Mn2+/Fe2+ NRAMP family transporter
MGVFASGPLVKAVAWLIFLLIAAANAWLIWGILVGSD